MGDIDILYFSLGTHTRWHLHNTNSSWNDKGQFIFFDSPKITKYGFSVNNDYNNFLLSYVQMLKLCIFRYLLSLLKWLKYTEYCILKIIR